MALFELNSDITIGTFRFSGVHEVHIKRSIHTYADSAVIVIPHMGRIKSKSHSFQDLTSLRKLINDRDPVTINLGYNGKLNEEFRGFVRRIGRGMPMEVECEGYVQQMRLDVNYTSGSEANPVHTTAKKLLLNALEGTDISLQCPVDFPIQNFYALGADATRVCDFIKQASDNALSIFFIRPDVLWCGLVYTPYAADSPANMFGMPTVKYQLGFNVVKDNGLKERINNEPTQIILNGKLANGTKMWTASKNKQVKKKMVKLLNNVPDVKTMAKYAQEIEYRTNYVGMEGHVNGFLQPFALPGYDAFIKDSDDADVKGIYLVEATDVSFGVKGARRIITVGPKVGFDK